MDIKTLLAKGENREELTAEEQEFVRGKVKEFTDEVSAVCEKHGLAYRAVVNYGKDGIAAGLEIVGVQKKTETEPEAQPDVQPEAQA